MAAHAGGFVDVGDHDWQRAVMVWSYAIAGLRSDTGPSSGAASDGEGGGWIACN